ncbi:MAG: sigma-70 family RNA polymerase sigma factor [Pirellulaceae bacterium]|nr:sigma-70 family RNA polymerase sigma factor [Pirellulaceae bacterium]
MTEPHALVEHFFRHEYGRMVGLLTRALGVRHLELVEDVVQSALSRALQSWARQGVPSDPSAWLFRTAKNLATDALRRDATFGRIASELASQLTSQLDELKASGLSSHDVELTDESLRLLYLCCHASIPEESQIALALKIVGGFSVSEIASGLLVAPANIEKRITRAKSRLRDIGLELAELTNEQMHARRGAVLHTLYLMFNEGFSATSGDSPLRQDVCDEAMRLARMQLAQPTLGEDPAAAALLALMLLHAARFCTRVDDQQCIVLLADQDRAQWNWARVREGMDWMLRSARGETLTRYHVEAAIAWEHCRAANFADTDWHRVVQLYDRLWQLAPSAMVKLNRLIAQSYSSGVQRAIQALLEFSSEDRRQLRPWWDCAMAQLFQRADQTERAQSHWRDALALAKSTASRQLIEKQLVGR